MLYIMIFQTFVLDLYVMYLERFPLCKKLLILNDNVEWEVDFFVIVTVRIANANQDLRFSKDFLTEALSGREIPIRSALIQTLTSLCVFL